MARVTKVFGSILEAFSPIDFMIFVDVKLQPQEGKVSFPHGSEDAIQPGRKASMAGA